MTTQQLIELIERAGHEWRWCSGRGMYGKECPAVVISSPAEANFLRDDLEEADFGGAERIPGPDVDSLGRQFVAYWPRCVRSTEAA